jgi:hypothetical protein
VIGFLSMPVGKPDASGKPDSGSAGYFAAAARIDRIADLLLQQGRTQQAETLSHHAADLRQGVLA